MSSWLTLHCKFFLQRNAIDVIGRLDTKCCGYLQIMKKELKNIRGQKALWTIDMYYCKLSHCCQQNFDCNYEIRWLTLVVLKCRMRMILLCNPLLDFSDINNVMVQPEHYTGSWNMNRYKMRLDWPSAWRWWAMLGITQTLLLGAVQLNWGYYISWFMWCSDEVMRLKWRTYSVILFSVNIISCSRRMTQILCIDDALRSSLLLLSFQSKKEMIKLPWFEIWRFSQRRNIVTGCSCS